MNFTYRLFVFIIKQIEKSISQFFGFLLFYFNNINFKKGIIFNGVPNVSIQGKVEIGKNLRINSNLNSNPIGRNYKCLFIVREGAKLVIGDNVGMSGTTIVCQRSIYIGNNVKIGGNVCLYDTDFHALDPILRQDSVEDKNNIVKKGLVLHDNVFIGAHSTILKGVSIGKNSIIGACSVVAKNIPENEIWAGNPAKFIKKLDYHHDT